MTSCKSFSGLLKQPSDDLWCPDVALVKVDKEGEEYSPCGPLADVPSSSPEFKLWAGNNLKQYSECKLSYDTLKQCWERESKKRNKK